MPGSPFVVNMPKLFMSMFFVGSNKDDDEESNKSESSGHVSHSHSGLLIPGSNNHSSSKKQRKARTAFTDHQLQTLEKSFERQKYLSVQDR